MTAPYTVAFVRDLSPKFSEAALTSHDNSQAPIDMALAHEQHEKYVEAVRKFVPNVNTVVNQNNSLVCCTSIQSFIYLLIPRLHAYTHTLSLSLSLSLYLYLSLSISLRRRSFPTAASSKIHV